MRKITAAFNMTLDGNCDHTVPNPDAEIHDHYSQLLNNAHALLYGRITFELMKFWQTLLSNPSEQQSHNDFAKAIDKVPKIVFSNSMQSTGWESAQLSDKPLHEKIKELKNGEGKDILICSRSLIIQLLNQNLIDELQLCIHPIIAGPGMMLFDKIEKRIDMNLRKTEIFKPGTVIHYYIPIRN
ncbi:dihydrofolate reductase family protein [Sphingobacterium sp.]|uniref:dihydrofolate reductase family protein n=1 Tax=Sphingobacterium sp. TaxID=341027 RepID=UPI0028B0AB02|nr:dihydrofolate reductase family protein [Sphingobacterium sp.]